jgi:hypothetical protein
MRRVVRIAALPFFVFAATFYLWHHFTFDASESGALSDFSSWLITIAIAAPGVVLLALSGPTRRP